MDAPTRVLCCGSRYWRERVPILRELRFLPAGSVVIHGGSRGADFTAGQVAEELGLDVEVHRFVWGDSRRAIQRRNQRLLDEGRPDLVVVFAPEVGLSASVQDMVERAKRAGVPVKIVER